MNAVKNFGVQRLLLGWGIFFLGLMLLAWLHTFRDRAPHRAIGPLLLLLWISLVVCLWDGCKMFSPRLRFVFLAVQIAAAVVASMLFVLHLIGQSV